MSKIAAKLVTAMKAVDAVEKRGRNEIQKYAYVKAADVANEVRKALISAGISFSYSVLSERTWEGMTKTGSTQYFCSLLISAMFTDSESGESFTVQAIGWGADSQDKAPYKAMTGALKYALRMNFLIPDESDPEEGHEEETTKKQRPSVIPKSKADLFRQWIIDNQFPKDTVRKILLDFGFENCNQITVEKFSDVEQQFVNLLPSEVN